MPLQVRVIKHGALVTAQSIITDVGDINSMSGFDLMGFFLNHTLDIYLNQSLDFHPRGVRREVAEGVRDEY